jgi:C-terminal processing protease CtpA/Prc
MKLLLVIFAFTLAAYAGEKEDIIQKIELLGAESYKVRKQAKKDLSTIISKNNKEFIILAKKKYLASKDPELRLNLLELIKVAVITSIKRPGFMGLTMVSAQVEDKDGAKPITINSVLKGTAAEKAGIRVNAIIYEIDDKKLSSKFTMEDLVTLVKNKVAGDTIKLKLKEDPKGALKEVKFKLGPRPLDQGQSLEKIEAEHFNDWKTKNLTSKPDA